MDSIILASTDLNTYYKSGECRSSGASSEAASAKPLPGVFESSWDVFASQACTDPAASNEPCSGVSARLSSFGEHTPSSIEKALHHPKPEVTLEFRIERTSERLGCIWLTY